MKYFILNIILIVFLISCGGVKDTNDNRQTKPKEDIISRIKNTADNSVTPDSDKASNIIWMQKKDSGKMPEFFDIYRVDPSNPDSIKIYAHLLDNNYNMINNLFKGLGYKICGFTDNGREINEYSITEIKKKAEDFSVAFVLDHSGSIGDARARIIQQSLSNVVGLKYDNDAFSVVKFDHRVNLEQPLNTNSETLKNNFQIIGLNGYGGATSLYDGIKSGINSIKDKNNKKVIIAISDGYDNSSMNGISDILKEAVKNNISVFTVGFGFGIDKSRMKYIAQRTGGKFYQIFNSNEFNNVFQDIYKRINTYYLIKYSAINYGRHEVKITLCKDDKKLDDVIIYYNDNIEDCDISMSLETRGVRPDGTEAYNPEVTIWERSNREYHPLLPYIFFDENSSEIPNRYFRRNTSQITNDIKYEYITNNDKTDIYHDILNIIAERWHQNSNAMLTLTGCNDGVNEGADNLVLSENRAIAVKNYLVNVCDIPSNYIQIKKRNRPSHPSGKHNPLAKEENRRVEIESDDNYILSPFIFETLEYDVSPPTLRTYVDILPKDEIHSWKVEFLKSNNLLWENQTFGDAPVEYVDYNINAEVTYNKKDGEYIISGVDNMQAQLTVYKDSLRQIKCSSEKKDIHIVQNTIEKITRDCLEGRQIETFNLILFGMNKSSYDESNLEKYLKPLLIQYGDGIYIDVYGHTDIIGSTSSNQILSDKRANYVANIIVQIIDETGVDANIRNLQGFGETLLPRFIDNELPEGRMYCRTVSIKVFLPIPCEEQ